MTNLRKYFGFRYSNNRKMFSRNRIKRAPAVARESCGGSGPPGAGLRGACGTPLQDIPERRLQDFPGRRLRVSRDAVCRVCRSAVCRFPGAPFGPLFGAIRGSFARLFRAGPRTGFRTCSRIYSRIYFRIYFRDTVRDASEAHRDREKRRNEGSRTPAAGPKDETGANTHVPAYWLPAEAAGGAAA